MANYSCINHPEKDYLLILRTWQIEFCEGDKVAAGLLSIFEYWYNIKYSKYLQKAEEDRKTKDLYQFHSETDLIDKMLSITHTPANIRKGINFLEEKQVITIHRNPSKRYAYDRTRHFLFHPEVINQWLTEQYIQSKKEQTAKKGTPHKGGDTEKNTTVQASKDIAPTPNQQQVISPPAADTSNNFNPEEQEIKHATILFSLLQDLPLKAHIKTSNILESLHNPALYQPVFDEWRHAIKQGDIKNKYAYLAALVKRANEGTFTSTQSQHQQDSQKIKGVIDVSRDKPRAQQAHDIFPPYKAWKKVQQALSKIIPKPDYMNFALPTRAYESDTAIFVRCPNIYSLTFMKNYMDKINPHVDKNVLLYLG